MVQLQSIAVVGFKINESGFPWRGGRAKVMLTAKCLFTELVSQFLLDINPRVHQFVFGEMSTHTFMKVDDCNNTQLFLSIRGCHLCQDCGIPLAFCPYSTAVRTTDVGKWLHCCIAVNNPMDQYYEAIDHYGTNAYEKSA